MKHNPRLNEKMARLPGIGDVHPLQPVSTVQGALEMMNQLSHWLMTLTNTAAVALTPKAGAHGEMAGMMAINNVMGEAGRLVQNSSEGAGFIGIAVALMGRNHPLGVLLAAILFGFLYQGGAELGLWTSIPIELRIVVQGLVILFTGALDVMVRMMLVWVFGLVRPRKMGVA